MWDAVKATAIDRQKHMPSDLHFSWENGDLRAHELGADYGFQTGYAGSIPVARSKFPQVRASRTVHDHLFQDHLSAVCHWVRARLSGVLVHRRTFVIKL
ncbi:hypothetical protein [Actinomadura vinacea]|uniref:hypothetical protein n=1 Tax=Actinomadura vinacea TaxID=115336 RepID=UPI0031D85FC8